MSRELADKYREEGDHDAPYTLKLREAGGAGCGHVPATDISFDGDDVVINPVHGKTISRYNHRHIEEIYFHH